MKKLIYWLILIGGAYFIHQIANVYCMLAFIGFFLAFGITLIKLHLSDALRLWAFVITFMVIMLGGAILLARHWSEFAAGVWIVICIILLFVFQNRIKKMIPIFYMAEMFEEIVKEKSGKRDNSS
jgi:hypothetical protein